VLNGSAPDSARPDHPHQVRASWVRSLVATRSGRWGDRLTVAVLVIACPHALGLVIPVVVATSTEVAARNGIQL